MASPSDGPLKRFIGEIHRRSIWQVLGIYLVASWAVLGGVGTLMDTLNLPEWFPPLALALLIVGLPIVLATAFVQQSGPSSDAGDVEVAGSEAPPSGTSGLFTWRKTFVGGVLAFALLGFVGTGWILFGGGMGTNSPPTSIEQSVAVLPFANLSGDPDNEYFSDGITEELLNALAQIPDLRVPGRTSSFAFKGQNITIQQIADTLDVAHVLEGSVRRDGERVMIAAQLVAARADTRIWSETFERELTDIFAIQREIATAIADQLQVTLSGDQQRRLVTEAAESTEAHEAYLRGRYFWNQRTSASLRSAITEFQRATDLDPGYAEAYSGLADSHLVLPNYVAVPTEIGEGVEAAQRAVELDPELGMARASLGLAHRISGQWESAEREMVRAIELSPGYATAHGWYSVLLAETGRADEAVVGGRRGVAADPVSPAVSNQLFLALSAAERDEEAVEQGRRTVELAPNWSMGWQGLAEALYAVGEYEEALEARLHSALLAGRDRTVVRGYHEAMTRYAQTGEPQLLSLPTDFVMSSRELMTFYAGTGQRERALEAFESLVQGGEIAAAGLWDVLWIRDLLGDDPRYQALLEEAGITW